MRRSAKKLQYRKVMFEIQMFKNGIFGYSDISAITTIIVSIIVYRYIEILLYLFQLLNTSFPLY